MSPPIYPIPQQIRQTDILLGDGGAVYGPFDFKIFDIEDVEAWTLAVGETHFSQVDVTVAKVADLPFDDFTVTFAANQLVTTEIVIRSARLDERAAGVLKGSGIDPTALEKEFSKISTEFQELRRDIDRAVVSDFGQGPLKLDAGLADGDTLMKLGDRLAKGANALDIANAQEFAEAAAQSATDAGTAAGLSAVSAAAAASAAAATAWRVFATVAEAAAATIPATATFVFIVQYSPIGRYFQQQPGDPGAVDKFQSANGLWFKGLQQPPTALDFANAVARSANATLVAGDLDQVHIWTIGTGTTYTATLPDPDSYIGRLLHLEVSASSRGLLAFSCPDPIGKFTPSELVIWGGESVTLIARAGRWEIIGGVCKPLSLFATNPGANISATWVANSGWVTAQQGGEEWAINAGGIFTPRAGYYTSSFKVGAAWAAAPSFIYSVANNNGGTAIHRNQVNTPAGTSILLPATREQVLAKGAAISPVVIWSGGTTVVVERATFGAPELSLKEMPQW